MPENMGNVRPPPMGYQHTHVPLHVPTNQRDQMEQQSTSSEDQDSSSDYDSDINMLGTTHAYQLCNMPIEGIPIINQPQMQYMELISAAIAMQIPNKIKKKIGGTSFFISLFSYRVIIRKIQTPTFRYSSVINLKLA